ncbi:MAG TPA: TetR/AcrR family transcriptional regulator [Gammaproteobacteria bacterium]|nr:TetR/AcrR family transcriptional regulator [Gammaproteobacteria bacterium]
MPRKTDKRVRLVDAAKALIHRQGFNLTTLADIAQEADVPLGNVYYYFKTKEAIGEAVIANRGRELHDALQTWEKAANVKERLLAYVQFEVDNAEETAMSGCPVGGLCQELAKQGGSLADAAAKLLGDTMLWVEKQFQGMGMGEASRGLAMQFVAAVQGNALLTNTFKDPKILANLKVSLSKWLDKVSSTKNASVPIEKVEEYA